MLRGGGLPRLADQAERELPDPVSAGQLEAWELENGISHDDLVSRFGGSP